MPVSFHRLFQIPLLPSVEDINVDVYDILRSYKRFCTIYLFAYIEWDAHCRDVSKMVWRVLPRRYLIVPSFHLHPLPLVPKVEAVDPTIGNGRFENTIFFFTIATMSQLAGSLFGCFIVPPSIASSSAALSFAMGCEAKGRPHRCKTPSGLGRETILPSSRWCPIESVGLI